MGRTLVISVCVAWLACGACAAGQAPTGRELLREAIATLARESLDADRVDWRALEVRLLERLPADAPAEQAHALIHEAVAALNDRHARFAPPPPRDVPAAERSREPARTDAEAGGKPDDAAAPRDQQPSPPSAPVRRVPDVPEGRMLEGGIAYIVAPRCVAPDVDGLRRYAHAGADAVRTLHRERPRGWILDLRLNGGGNVWPMLLGLRPLLRDGVVMTMVRGSAVEASFGVDAASAWMGSPEAPVPQLRWRDEDAGDAASPALAPIDAPVAVLLGPWTMSSGEALAIALRVRPAVRSFGQPTAGLTTVTNVYPLADGSTLILSVSQMGDAQGRASLGALQPDEPAEIGDWPTADDAVVRAATTWINTRAPAAPTPGLEKP